VEPYFFNVDHEADAMQAVYESLGIGYIPAEVYAGKLKVLHESLVYGSQHNPDLAPDMVEPLIRMPIKSKADFWKLLSAYNQTQPDDKQTFVQPFVWENYLAQIEALNRTDPDNQETILSKFQAGAMVIGRHDEEPGLLDPGKPVVDQKARTVNDQKAYNRVSYMTRLDTMLLADYVILNERRKLAGLPLLDSEGTVTNLLGLPKVEPRETMIGNVSNLDGVLWLGGTALRVIDVPEGYGHRQVISTF
jgi:hypothetical protein